MAGRMVWLGGRYIAIVSNKAMQTAWFEVRSLDCNLLLLKKGCWGARCFKCTTMHNRAPLNHAKLPQQLTKSGRLFLLITTRLLDRTGVTDLQHQIVSPFALDIDMRRCAEE